LVLAAARLTHRAEHNQPPVLDIVLDLFSYLCDASRLNFQPQETAPVSTADPDPIPAPAKPAYTIPPQNLRDMVLMLPRPPADTPETAWQDVVQGGLDWLGVLDPRDALQTMLAVTVIATRGGRRLPAGVRRGCIRSACAAPPGQRRLTGARDDRALRSLKQRRLQPAAPARDWGDAAEVLAAVLPDAPARPAEAAHGGKAAMEEPAEIIRWIDEIDDAEMKEQIERLRREAAGEPPLPVKPGPRRIYKYKPDDDALTWVPDERAARKYPGWENRTKPERREFFGDTYTGPVAPLEMLMPGRGLLPWLGRSEGGARVSPAPGGLLRNCARAAKRHCPRCRRAGKDCNRK
jgi:hypothetical protein